MRFAGTERLSKIVDNKIWPFSSISKCVNMSVKFHEGPNMQAESRMNKDFEKFGKEVYTPHLSFDGGRTLYSSSEFTLVFQERFTYRVRIGFSF